MHEGWMMVGLQLRRFFHILYSYAEDLTFSITGNGPGLLKASFLVGRSELMFEPSTHTRSLSLYSMVFPRFFSSSLHLFFSGPFQLPLLHFLSSGQTCLLLELSSHFSSSPRTFGCLPRFIKMGTSLCLNVVCCYMKTQP